MLCWIFFINIIASKRHDEENNTHTIMVDGWPRYRAKLYFTRSQYYQQPRHVPRQIKSLIRSRPAMGCIQPRHRYR